MQTAKYFVSGLAVAFLVSATGCDSGPKMGTVTGTVTLDGEPAAHLEVSFNPKTAGTGTTALGYTDSNGAYNLSYPGGKTGAPVGDYSVSIVGAELSDEGNPPVAIPACYNTETTLSFSVAPGENTANFDLESSGN